MNEAIYERSQGLGFEYNCRKLGGGGGGGSGFPELEGGG